MYYLSFTKCGPKLSILVNFMFTKFSMKNELKMQQSHDPSHPTLTEECSDFEWRFFQPYRKISADQS